MPLVNMCERRLGGVSSMLNQAGRLQITNAVFSSLPTFYMCTLELPKAVIKQIDKFRKNCLWRGNNVNGGSRPKAAWEMVCNSKEEGGLGIINLELQNQALLMKILDKFFNRKRHTLGLTCVGKTLLQCQAPRKHQKRLPLVERQPKTPGEF